MTAETSAVVALTAACRALFCPAAPEDCSCLGCSPAAARAASAGDIGLGDGGAVVVPASEIFSLGLTVTGAVSVAAGVTNCASIDPWNRKTLVWTGTAPGWFAALI